MKDELKLADALGERGVGLERLEIRNEYNVEPLLNGEYAALAVEQGYEMDLVATNDQKLSELLAHWPFEKWGWSRPKHNAWTDVRCEAPLLPHGSRQIYGVRHTVTVQGQRYKV